MDVYFYCEYNGCENSGKPVKLGRDSDYSNALKGEAVAVLGRETGDFSGSAICLGDFDGVHLGHSALFDVAKKYGKWGVLLFDRNTKGSTLLTTQAEKIERISKMGADFAVIVEFSEKFSHKSPEGFVCFLKNILNVDVLVAGYDYRFGYKAAGDKDKLIHLSEKYGLGIKIVDRVTVDGETVKSTKIRELIKNGNIVLANKLLGYNYFVSGIVEKGLNNGTKMGFPTANIVCFSDKLLPADGVYAGKCLGYDAVINIGKNPTFDAKKRTVEAHLIDYFGDLYEKDITVEITEKIRDDIKFQRIENLIEQIKNDIKCVKERK